MSQKGIPKSSSQTGADLEVHVRRIRKQAADLSSIAKKLGAKKSVSFAGEKSLKKGLNWVDRYIANAATAVRLMESEE